MRWALVLVFVLLLSGCGGGPTALESAKVDCGGPDDSASLGDEGYSLYLDSAGEETGGLKIETMICYFDALGTSDAVRRQMEATRAMDGTRTGSWDGFEAEWTYHPNEGLNVLIEEAP